MRTRGLKLVVDSEGIYKTKKTDIEDYKRKKLRKVYGGKIKGSLLNTLNILINYYKEYNKDDVSNESEEFGDESKIKSINDLISKIRNKYDNNYEDYVASLSSRICNKCYDEYCENDRMLKRKIFDITSNIKRVNNYELREKILLNQISINELIKLEIVELAPEELKNQRRAQVENHYIRNVILNAPAANTANSQSLVQSRRSSPDKEHRTVRSQLTAERDKLSTIENLKEFFLNNSSSHNSHNKTHNRRIIGNNEDDTAPSNRDRDESDALDLENEEEERSLEKDERRTKSVKLPTPPNVSQFKYETISLRLANRINGLPTNFRRPFLDNFRQATRRLEILMKRSSILTGKLT